MSNHDRANLRTQPHSTSAPAAGLLQRACACGNHTAGGGECEHCKRLQRFGTEPISDLAPPIVHEVLRTSGQPLDPATRAALEPRFGHDFSRVRVHTDPQAAASARAVNAHAYTVGSHVAFGSGRYAPGTPAGDRLIAHELAHVVQQRNAPAGVQAKLAIDGPQSAAEQEAEGVARSLAGHASVQSVAAEPLQSAGSVLQRQTDMDQYLRGENHVFDSQGEARAAALLRATELGPGHTIAHDPLPSRGLPHYHIVGPDSRRIPGHFFYRTRRRRRQYRQERRSVEREQARERRSIDTATVLRALAIIGVSIALAATVIAALLDPEPATKLGLIGLSAAQIALLMSLVGVEDQEESGPIA